jgi:hypothetical protein
MIFEPTRRFTAPTFQKEGGKTVDSKKTNIYNMSLVEASAVVQDLANVFDPTEDALNMQMIKSNIEDMKRLVTGKEMQMRDIIRGTTPHTVYFP